MKAIYNPAAPILLSAIFFVMASGARADETGFLNRTVKIGNETYRYQVYVPRDWNKNRKWPVILFLHGAGERGDDGFVQTEVGLGGAIRRHVDRFPAVVVMPQCRKNLWWTQDAMQEQAFAAFEQSVAVDPNVDPYAEAAKKNRQDPGLDLSRRRGPGCPAG